jgi:hypothetical protein
MQYDYSKKMFIRRDKAIQIIGDLGTQRTGKWSYNVHTRHYLAHRILLRMRNVSGKSYREIQNRFYV